ncbi:MAG: NAD(P)H-binding protein [bacterium]|nr:NAD(P)H-binding protein [bacterium]
MSPRVVITGANSAVGQVVLERALLRDDLEVIAAVRSERAAGELPVIPEDRGRIALIDYASPETLAKAFADASALIHLPGLLIESATSSYETANVETTRAAVNAAKAAGLAKLVLVSAVGADITSRNRYFHSKAKAEQMVAQSGMPYTILRCPMVLACRSHGVRALVRETGQKLLLLNNGGRHRDQPIDARDLADGALNAASDTGCACNQVLDTVGPESMPVHAVISCGARLRNVSQRIVPIPTGPIKLALALKQRLAKGGMTPEVMEVMELDVNLDAKRAAQALGIELRPLDETLRESFALWEE